jgi:hypothetical protein
VTSGLNHETNRAFDLSFLEIAGSQAEFQNPIKGCLRCLDMLIARVPGVGFFLWVTVIKPSESACAEDTLGLKPITASNSNILVGFNTWVSTR